MFLYSVMQDHFVLEGSRYASYRVHGGCRCGLIPCEHVGGDGQDGAHALLILRTSA
jgi:hypothetical protein